MQSTPYDCGNQERRTGRTLSGPYPLPKKQLHLSAAQGIFESLGRHVFELSMGIAESINEAIENIGGCYL